MLRMPNPPICGQGPGQTLGNWNVQERSTRRTREEGPLDKEFHARGPVAFGSDTSLYAFANVGVARFGNTHIIYRAVELRAYVLCIRHGEAFRDHALAGQARSTPNWLG